MKESTGERLETFIFNETTIEHLHRYAIAKILVTNKKVLDIACGEGYGTNLLAETADSVIGVDIDNITISNANNKYKKSNLKFIHGNVESIPFDGESFDIVVSFETLEHTDQHEKMFSEIKRVLKNTGLLIISTPDKHYYSDKRQYKNPFHKRELFKGQFISLINHNFKNAAFFQQSYLNSSLLIPLSENKNITVFKGNYHVIEEQSYEPFYLLSVASDYEIPDLGISVFCSDQTIGQALQKKEMDIKSTYSYRIGHFLLFPFKIIRSFFRNKKAL